MGHGPTSGVAWGFFIEINPSDVLHPTLEVCFQDDMMNAVYLLRA